MGILEGMLLGWSAASSMLALLIPPSIPMIVFAMTAQVSILAAFLSTMIPGLLLMVAYCIINLIMCRNMPNLKVAPRQNLKDTVLGIGRSTKSAGVALFMPVLVLGRSPRRCLYADRGSGDVRCLCGCCGPAAL